MAVSRRLRFEILRRDGHTCRYCGASAPDVKLTVDHVIPVALGGGDEPNNLVTACKPCNDGKSSTNPDSPLVEDVDATALLFARAMEKAAQARKVDVARLDHTQWEFDKAWSRWRWNKTADNPDGEVLPRDTNWRASIERFVAAGLDLNDLERFVVAAMESNVYCDKTWRYFCKCCWNEVTERQELARRLIEDGEV